MIDRTEISRLLGKTLAYLACGKRAEASQYARQLVQALTAAGIEF